MIPSIRHLLRACHRRSEPLHKYRRGVHGQQSNDSRANAEELPANLVAEIDILEQIVSFFASQASVLVNEYGEPFTGQHAELWPLLVIASKAKPSAAISLARMGEIASA